MDTIAPPTAADLRAALARHGVRRYEIAPAAGIHPVRLGKLLNGRRKLTPETATRIWRAIEEVVAR